MYQRKGRGRMNEREKSKPKEVLRNEERKNNKQTPRSTCLSDETKDALTRAISGA